MTHHTPTPEQIEAAARTPNSEGWTCYRGADEPGNYDGCEECRRVCRDVARKVLDAALAAAPSQPVEGDLRIVLDRLNEMYSVRDIPEYETYVELHGLIEEIAALPAPASAEPAGEHHDAEEHQANWTDKHYVTRNSTTEDPSGYRVWMTCRCGWGSGALPDGNIPTTHRAELEHYATVVLALSSQGESDDHAAAATGDREKRISDAAQMLDAWLSAKYHANRNVPRIPIIRELAAALAAPASAEPTVTLAYHDEIVGQAQRKINHLEGLVVASARPEPHHEPDCDYLPCTCGASAASAEPSEDERGHAERLRGAR